MRALHCPGIEAKAKVALSFVFPSLFSLLITLAIVFQVMGQIFTTFEEFKITLAVLETIFAIYVSQFIDKALASESPQSGH